MEGKRRTKFRTFLFALSQFSIVSIGRRWSTKKKEITQEIIIIGIVERPMIEIIKEEEIIITEEMIEDIEEEEVVDTLMIIVILEPREKVSN